MCWWNSVVLNTKRFNNVLFSRRLKSLCSIHSWSLFCAWYRIWRTKVIYVCCNSLVIVFRDHFNFRVIIWSWQHYASRYFRCAYARSLKRGLRVVYHYRYNSFSVKHTCVKVISTVLENISRSPCTSHDSHGGDQNERMNIQNIACLGIAIKGIICNLCS